MRDFRNAKAMAQSLRESLAIKSVTIGYSESLEIIAKTFGLADWNALSAQIQDIGPKLANLPADVSSKTIFEELYCSFCGKSQKDVTRLIAGPGVYICDECLALCDDVLIEETEDLDHTINSLADQSTERLIRLEASAAVTLANGRKILDLLAHVDKGDLQPIPVGRLDPQRTFVLAKSPSERTAYRRGIEERMAYIERVLHAATAVIRDRGLGAQPLL